MKADRLVSFTVHVQPQTCHSGSGMRISSRRAVALASLLTPSAPIGGFGVLKMFTSAGAASALPPQGALLPALHSISPAATPPLFWFSEVASTMDTAREIVQSLSRASTQSPAAPPAPPPSLDAQQRKLFAVMAASQSSGRGTRGRTWLSPGNLTDPENLYLTIVIPRAELPPSLPLTLVPLRVGTLILPAVTARTSHPAYLKWPNDVLINDKKVCGILMVRPDPNPNPQP